MYWHRSISALTSLICLSVLVLWIPTAKADDYAVTVSRDAKDYYVGKGSWHGVIKTQFCYEYVTYDNATLSLTTSSTGTLFFSSGQQCSVENVFEPASYPPGSYTAYVNSDGNGYYEVTDGSYLFEALGYDYAYSESAVIEITSAINGIAFGTIKVGNSPARSLTNMYVSWGSDVSPSNYTLSVSKTGSGSGTVSSNPAGINCGSTCSASYTSGTSVTLTANPASGSTFGGWSGSCSGTGTCTVSMTQARNVSASFNATATNFTLSVSKSGSGSGTVSSNPAGINCGSTCSASYTSNTTVTLTANPASGSTFDGWSGSCSGTGTCTVSMTQARNVSASFNATATNFTLSVSKSGSGSGTVSSNPAGINCGSTCSASYTSGTSVTLTANPASGSTFGGWSGSCSGTGTCTVSMTQARNVSANFSGSGTSGVTPDFSGLWYNPAQDGHGFSISVHSATSASVYWYTFDPFGGPLWIYGAGDIIGNRIESTGFMLQGMEFGSWDPLAKQVFDWGSFEIEFHSCDSATLTYDSTLGYQSGEEFGSGTFPLVRLAAVDGLECGTTEGAPPAVTPEMTYNGLWYNPAQDGHGFSISVHSATSASVYWYTFDPFGDAVWIYGAGDIIGNRIESTGYFLTGMMFGTWDPSEKQVWDWGTFEIRFDSCDSATLTYDSTLGYQSGEEFGSGTFPLVRLAPIDGLDCP